MYLLEEGMYPMRSNKKSLEDKAFLLSSLFAISPILCQLTQRRWLPPSSLCGWQRIGPMYLPASKGLSQFQKQKSRFLILVLNPWSPVKKVFIFVPGIQCIRHIVQRHQLWDRLLQSYPGHLNTVHIINYTVYVPTVKRDWDARWIYLFWRHVIINRYFLYMRW